MAIAPQTRPSRALRIALSEFSSSAGGINKGPKKSQRIVRSVYHVAKRQQFCADLTDTQGGTAYSHQTFFTRQ
jgi:hypothetical protein